MDPLRLVAIAAASWRYRTDDAVAKATAGMGRAEGWRFQDSDDTVLFSASLSLFLSECSRVPPTRLFTLFYCHVNV